MVAARVPSSGALPVSARLRFDPITIDTTISSADHLPKVLRPESRIIIRRAIAERVPRIAPFLTYDADPYAAIVDGRLKWIWDAYTTTDAYPYAQEVNLGDVTTASVTGPSPTGTVNYIRNSVKAVVDAYDGSVTLYLVDPNDPIAAAWSNPAGCRKFSRRARTKSKSS